MKAAPCRLCLNTLPCCSGTAGRTSLNFSSGADPLVWRQGKPCFTLKRAGLSWAGVGLGWLDRVGCKPTDHKLFAQAKLCFC